ncbi:hypothetical protein KJ708_12750 [bacterium]|nr:hypothetical protein [bacterium]
MKKIIIFLISILLVSQVCALSAEIIVKSEFYLGETMTFDYTLSSEKNQKIVYSAFIECSKDIPIPLLDIKQKELIAGSMVKESYIGITVEDLFEPQVCKANLEIFSPVKQTFTKEFLIITQPKTKIRLLSCKTPSCSQKSKTFILRENIYLDYSSSIKDLSQTATLTYPDETTRSLTLPTSIKATQTGTYTLEVTASKESYKTTTQTTEFAVISKNANIQEADLQAQKEISLSPPPQTQKYLISFLVIIAIAITIFLLLRKKKK